VVEDNQGLFIKMGQAIGLQAALLPKPYREAFANIFDSAPSVSYAEIQKVFVRDFGKTPEEVFVSFDELPIASASIAQVHLADVKRWEVNPDGSRGREWTEKVAVKVQKPAIRKQMEWDLWSYRCVLVGLGAVRDDLVR
jgi:aarF domain-containing kinase